MTTFYIATSLRRTQAHNIVRDALQKRGLRISYDWTVHGDQKSTSGERLQEIAVHMTRGVYNADIVIVLLPGGPGTHTELGMALGAGKEVIIHSEDERSFTPCADTVAFYHLPQLHRFVCPLEQLGDKILSLLEIRDEARFNDAQVADSLQQIGK